MRGLGGCAVALFFVCVLIFYFSAYAEGAHEWFGWRGWVAIVIGITAIMFLGELAMLVMLVVAAYGMWRGWGWPLWLSIVAAFPWLAFAAFMLLTAGVGGYVNRVRRLRNEDRSNPLF